jgi:hypothetical protein
MWFPLLTLVCCCGVPLAYLYPYTRQYPVSASLPLTVADLSLQDDTASRETTQRLADQAWRDYGLVEDAFAAVYADDLGKKVIVSGVTGLRLRPDQDVTDALTAAGPVDHVRTFNPGELGVHVSCGVGHTENGATAAVCAWADHGSVANVVLTRRSVRESAALVNRFREALLTRGA